MLKNNTNFFKIFIISNYSHYFYTIWGIFVFNKIINHRWKNNIVVKCLRFLLFRKKVNVPHIQCHMTRYCLNNVFGVFGIVTVKVYYIVAICRTGFYEFHFKASYLYNNIYSFRLFCCRLIVYDLFFYSSKFRFFMFF